MIVFGLSIEIVGELILMLLYLVLLDFDGLKKDLGEIGDAFKKAWKKIADIFTGRYFEGIDKWWDDLQKMIEHKLEDIVRGIRRWWGDITETFLKPFRDIYDALVGNSIMSDLVDDIVAFIEELPDQILRVAGALFDAGVELGVRLYNGISSKVAEIVSKMPGWMGNVANKISDAAQAFWDKAWGVASNVFNAINNRISDIKNAIAGWMGGVAGKIADAGSSFWDKAWSLASQVYNAINNRIVNIRDSIAGWLTTVSSYIGNAASSFWNAAWGVANEIYNGFRDIFFNADYGLSTRLRSWFTTLVNTITGFATSFYNAAWNVGDKIYTGMLAALATLGSALRTLIKSVWNDHLRHGFNTLLDGIESAINFIINALNAFWRALNEPPIGGFPIPPVYIPPLPRLDVGGVITQDIVAQLHAGEVVLPLDRLDSIMRNMGMQGMPAFAPVLNFYPGSDPQRVMPGIREAYDWYIEESRR